jgi:NTE family protein
MVDSDGQPKLALALGGGGVRGAAHLGVLRALQQEGFRIHGIAGTSSGAIAAMLFALGRIQSARSRTDLYRLIGAVATRGYADLQHLFRDHKNENWRDRLRTITIGERVIRSGLLTPGMTTIEPLRASLHALAGTARFEDLEMPVAFVAADLYSGERVVLQQGRLLESVLASCAIPGILPPVELDGRLLIDGHVVENVPVSVARELVDGPSVVVAVDIGFEPPAQAPKTAFDVMMRSAAISREHLRRASLAAADLVVTIGEEVPAHLFEYDRARDLFDAGFERGKAVIPEIRAALESRRPAAEPKLEKRKSLDWRAAISRIKNTLEA